MYETEVLIVGAGPTGLTLAIELARRGISFRLIEAATSPFLGSRGKGIQPRTLEILHNLGVSEPILAAGARYPRLRIHLGPISLRAGSLSSSKAPTEGVPYPSLWMVPQSRTEQILRERLATLDGAVSWGEALATFTQYESGVSAVLTSGEVVRAHFLVGCDGGHSTVRKGLGLRLVGDALDARPILVADLKIEGLDRCDWHVWPFAASGPMALCPLPNTPLFQLTTNARIAATGIERAVLKITGHRVEQILWNSSYQAAVRMVDRYRVGRVFLAGDAAHVHPPAGGQGLNTGIQDAYNLGWKLASVIRGQADSLLETYEVERLPIAAGVLGLSKRLFQTKSIKRRETTDQLGLNYRNSPLSSGTALGRLHPGDRMPDLRLKDGSKFFDHLRGTQATELVTPEGPRLLIRPDGYIAHIGTKQFSQYAGSPTRIVHGTLSRLGLQ